MKPIASSASSSAPHGTVEIVSDSLLGRYFILRGEGKPLEIWVDFQMRHGLGLKTDLLARALGWKRGTPLRVLDATAGLCRDSFHMACLGCDVLALEQNAQIFEVVSDQLARLDAEFKPKILRADAVTYMNELRSAGPGTKPPFDVVYLDPMFAEKKKSAKSGKETELLKVLAPPPAFVDEVALLEAALASAQKRVVVKRAPNAPFLGLREPQSQQLGKAARYDVYAGRRS